MSTELTSVKGEYEIIVDKEAKKVGHAETYMQ